MRYIPATEKDREAMCQAIGVPNVRQLFEQIPEELHLKRKLILPSPMTEMELVQHMNELADEGRDAVTHSSFLGGGSYRHFIPAFIGDMVSRGEFLTAYTPYQPEIAQGKLQLMYEFQTYITMLTGMDVSGASLYDGATATAEAILMAQRITKKNVVHVSLALHPHYREVIKTYLQDSGITMLTLPFDPKTGMTTYPIVSDACAVVVGYPNYFGVIEDLAEARKSADTCHALLISVTTEALALALLKPPAEFGVDIATGEGQSFGLPVGGGGPYLGLLATRDKYFRQMPGRLIGRGKDLDGRDAYLIVVSTREQHIRREKATSNICTNQALCAIQAALYLSAYGKNLQTLARLNVERAHFLKDRLFEINGVSFPFSGPTFNEFVIRLERPPKRGLARWFSRSEANDSQFSEDKLWALSERGIFGGIPLSEHYPELRNCILVNATEMNSIEEIVEFADTLEEVLQ